MTGQRNMRPFDPNELAASLRFLPKLLWLIPIFLLLRIMFSIYYQVEPSEQGIVTRFGKYARSTGPGFHFKIPWPIENVETPSITEVRRIEVGFRTIGQGSPAQYEKMQKESQMLTGDENIVLSEFIVQYKISDAKDFLFNARDPETAVRDAAEAAHRQVVGDAGIDAVLTSGKTEIQSKTKDLLQTIIDKYKMGIQIVAIQLQDVYPPKQVEAAFKDVASAREDMAKTVNVARGYQSEVIPRAEGEAAKLIAEASGYRAERISTAVGDADRFLQVLAEYEKSPDITKDRLYIESMTKIYPRLDKILIEDSKEGILKYLDLAAPAATRAAAEPVVQPQQPQQPAARPQQQQK